MLEKALYKFPQGTAKRWEQVTQYVRTRGQDEVINMVKVRLAAGAGIPDREHLIPFHVILPTDLLPFSPSAIQAFSCPSSQCRLFHQQPYFRTRFRHGSPVAIHGLVSASLLAILPSPLHRFFLHLFSPPVCLSCQVTFSAFTLSPSLARLPPFHVPTMAARMSKPLYREGLPWAWHKPRGSVWHALICLLGSRRWPGVLQSA